MFRKAKTADEHPSVGAERRATSSRRGFFALAAVVVAVVAALLVLGFLSFNAYFDDKIHDERVSQLNEIVEQVGATFSVELDSNWQLLAAAKNESETRVPASQADVAALAGEFDAIMDADSLGGFFIFLDNRGQSYDANGTQGVWADFDQVGSAEQSTFIADSRSYDGVYWAFVQKLDAPITTQDGSTTITHVALLRSTDSMSQFFASSAYQDVAETYVLEENGTRLYDNSDSDDTLDSYNVFKALREAEAAVGDDFSEVEAELAQYGVASHELTYGGAEYCYSLYLLEDYGIVLLFLVPADAIAANTVEMASSLVAVLMGGFTVIAVLVGVGALAIATQRGRMRLYEQDRANLRKMEEANRRLEETNLSLATARQAAESALSVAESANKAKSNFLSDMSHDIRTPMNAIIGFVQLLERDADDVGKVREHTGKIRLASQHLLSLINDVLDMSRIESGKMTLNTEAFEVGGLVRELEATIAPLAADKHLGVHVSLDVDEDLAVMGDKLRLSQILMNFLSNAVRYTPEGGDIWFSVEKLNQASRPETSQGGDAVWLRFSVKDNGVGMSKEFQQRMFSPFEREQNTTASGVQGTGLGLAINKNLVDLMGGIITVESEPGRGSDFRVDLAFLLPDTDDSATDFATDADAATDAATDAAADAVGTLQDVLKGVHFLLVEDNAVNAEIAVELLKMEGATCDVAENGLVGFRKFSESEPGTYDAILMDVQMPVMDGYEAARAIRDCDHPDAASIPIAAMTANAFAEDAHRALEAGMDDHIPKPFEMLKVKQFVAHVKER